MIWSNLWERFISSDDRIVEALNRAARGDGNMSVAEIRRCALETSSSKVRNAAVIALADMHAPEAMGIIIELLGRPETKGSRGSILYALSEIEGPVPLDILVNIITDESYEASEEALGLLSRAKFTSDDLRRAIARLTAAARTTDRRRVASEALELLTTH